MLNSLLNPRAFACLAVTFQAFFSFLVTVPVWAVAKKSTPVTTQCQVPAVSMPNPLRPAIVENVGAQVFQLPNGGRADIGVELNSILNTVVNSYSNIVPFDPSSTVNADPCASHLELRSTVSNFQLNLVQLGVSVGFSPGGSLSSLTSVTGSADLNIGTISMDFSLWQCTSAGCISLASSTADQTTYGGSLALTIDFSVITAGPSLIYNTPIGGIMRTIMQKGITNLVSSSRYNLIPWQAYVREYIPAAGLLIFDQGSQSGIALNQNFEIYAPANYATSGSCDLFNVIAYAHTTTVDAVSSMALVDKLVNSTRGILNGDVVMINPSAL